MMKNGMRVGIDLGGTKIEGIVLAADGSVLVRRRVETPRNQYGQTVSAIESMVHELERGIGADGLSVGVATPGCVERATGRMKNCNSTCLNGQALPADLENALGRPVRTRNDADCLALSESWDGAAAGARSLFAVILGTGVGGGIIVNGQLLEGPNGGTGEWGHNPLPRAAPEELSRQCWCGLPGCMETLLSGPGLADAYRRMGGPELAAHDIVSKVPSDPLAEQALCQYEIRLAKALSSVINLLDPEVIVLGGGLSRIGRLYDHVPELWREWVFGNGAERTRLEPAFHGDASGVRGAARLWPLHGDCRRG